MARFELLASAHTAAATGNRFCVQRLAGFLLLNGRKVNLKKKERSENKKMNDTQEKSQLGDSKESKESFAAATGNVAAGVASSGPTSILDVNDVEVVLTYKFPAPGGTVIKFTCDLIENESEIAARQSFFAQSPEEQKAGRHTYNVNLLAAVNKTVPEGLPGFLDAFETVNKGQSGFATHRLHLAAAIRHYFADPTNIKVKIVSDAVRMYSTITQPEEFFR